MPATIGSARWFRKRIDLARSRLCHDLEGRGSGAVDHLVDVTVFCCSDYTHTRADCARASLTAVQVGDRSGVSFAWLPKRGAS